MAKRHPTPSTYNPTPSGCQPDGGEVLVEVVAGADLPAFHLAVVRNDPLPPDRRDLPGLLAKRDPLELAHRHQPLRRVGLTRLLVVELVELGIAVAAVIDRAAIARDELGQLQVGIVHEVTVEV